MFIEGKEAGQGYFTIFIDDNEMEDIVNAIKVKILDAIKHHVKKCYHNKRIVMVKQHSYHIDNDYDAYVLNSAIEILNIAFIKHNIPITVEVGNELQEYFNIICLNKQKDIPITFTINK